MAGLTGTVLGYELLTDPLLIQLVFAPTDPAALTFQRAETEVGGLLTAAGSLCLLVSLCGCVGAVFDLRGLLVMVSGFFLYFSILLIFFTHKNHHLFTID